MSLKFGHLLAAGGGKIVSGRENNYNVGAASDSNLQFYITKTGTDTEKMRIMSSGNVGIGTTNPPRKLTIEGDISASDAIMGITHITASGIISASTLHSTAGLQVNGSDINFNNLPVSQSGLTSGQLYTMSGSQLPFSASASELNVISSQKFVLIA